MPDKEIMLQIKALEEQRGWQALDALVTGQTESGDEAVGLRGAFIALAENMRQCADLYERAKGKGFKTAHVDPLRTAAQQLDIVVKQLDQPRRAPLGQLQPTNTAQDPCDMVMKPHAPHDNCPGVGRTREEIETAAGLDEPVHGFRPGGIGDTCIEHILRNDVEEMCGRYASHPAHRMQDNPASAPESLDALIAETAAKARPLAERPGDLDTAPPIAHFTVEQNVEPPGDVAAYLRGEVADLPTEPPRALVGAHSPGADSGQSLDTPRSAHEILENHDVTSPSTIPPAPLLGQPGDAGPGYAAIYVPPGGVSATFAELLTLVPVAALPPHISHSQIEAAGECGTKYRLSRLTEAPREGGPVVQVPEWAQIGGRAFHAWVEAYERAAPDVERSAYGAAGLTDAEYQQEWNTHFDAEISRIEQSSPVPRGRWRAANKGAEHEAWWRANGPEMLKRYLAARPDEATWALPEFAEGQLSQTPAVELERTAGVPTPYGSLPYKFVIDRVTVRTDPESNWITLVIRDYKTGKSMPDDPRQLGEYAQALRLLGVPPHVKIVGTFFNARKGTWTPEVDLEAEGFTAEWFAWRVTTGHAQRLALTTGPTPARPSSFCGGCSVRWACPIKGVRAKGGAA